MRVKIGTEEDFALVNDITPLLDKVDPVRQQKVLEILIAIHVARSARTNEKRQFVLNGIMKHALQILGLWT